MKEQIVITKAEAKDVIGIVIRLSSDPQNLIPRSLPEVRRHLNDFLVAKDERGNVIGCVAVHRITNRVAKLRSLSVSPVWHGQGIAKRLIEECLQETQKKGYHSIYGETFKPEFFVQFGMKTTTNWKMPVTAMLSFKLENLWAGPGYWKAKRDRRARYFGMCLLTESAHPANELMPSFWRRLVRQFSSWLG